MDNSYFNDRIQSILSQLMMRMLDKATGGSGTTTGGTPTATWVREGHDVSYQVSYDGGQSGGGREMKFEALIQAASEKYNVDADLVRSVIRAESGFNPNAISSAGAQGLMQLMPGTARGLGVQDALDPVQNVEGGVKLLRQLLNRYDGNVELALAAYNAGPGAVDRYGGIPPYRETQVYVQRVLGFYGQEQTWSA